MNKVKITRENWQGLIKFSINRLRGDFAIAQLAVGVYTAAIVGNWSLNGCYTILGLCINKKLLLALLPLLVLGYAWFDLAKMWLSEQKFNANNHPFQQEFETIKKELAEIKKHLGIGQERPIRTFWDEPNGC